MLDNFKHAICKSLFGKGGETMMAMLWAQEIMNQETVEDAKKMYERVPRLLKTKVKDILVRSGMGEITEE